MGNSASSKLHDKLYEIGEEEYERRGEYTLRNIYYSQQVLKKFAKSKTRGERSSGLFNHDYLILELSNHNSNRSARVPENLSNHNFDRSSPYDTVYMVAEKRSSPERGIILSWLDVAEEEDILNRAQLFPCRIGPPLGFHRVADILRHHEVRYGIFRRNCWYYAQAMTWNLLTECIRNCDNENERNRLKQELREWINNDKNNSWMATILRADLEEGDNFDRRTGFGPI